MERLKKRLSDLLKEDLNAVRKKNDTRVPVVDVRDCRPTPN